MRESNQKEMGGIGAKYRNLKEVGPLKEGGVGDGLKVPGVRLIASRSGYTGFCTIISLYLSLFLQS